MLPSNPEAHKFDCEDNLGICQKWYEQFRDNIKRSGTTDDLNVLWRRFHWSRIKVLFGIRRLRNSSASCYHLGKIRHPWEVVSDNGLPFSAQGFARIASNWEFWYITSSPIYPQLNGLAEKAVHTAEQLLKKTKLDPYLSVLEYINAPLQALATPVQFLMSRNLRSILLHHFSNSNCLWIRR